MLPLCHASSNWKTGTLEVWAKLEQTPMNNGKIKVLIVDDSAIVRKLLTDAIFRGKRS